jgi:hypothetical protein
MHYSLPEPASHPTLANSTTHASQVPPGVRLTDHINGMHTCPAMLRPVVLATQLSCTVSQTNPSTPHGKLSLHPALTATAPGHCIAELEPLARRLLNNHKLPMLAINTSLGVPCGFNSHKQHMPGLVDTGGALQN